MLLFAIIKFSRNLKYLDLVIFDESNDDQIDRDSRRVFIGGSGPAIGCSSIFRNNILDIPICAFLFWLKYLTTMCIYGYLLPT
jgi:hypothetical protein